MDVSSNPKPDGNVMTIMAGTGTMKREETERKEAERKEIERKEKERKETLEEVKDGKMCDGPMGVVEHVRKTCPDDLTAPEIGTILLKWADRVDLIRGKLGEPLDRISEELMLCASMIREGTMGLLLRFCMSIKENADLKDEIERLVERKETERKKLKRKEMEKEKMERKEKEEMERKETERKEIERKESERKKMEGKEMERKEMERKEMERKEAERKKIERKEMERKEMEREEMKRKEMERKEIERKELERKEMERKDLGKKETLEVLDREGKKKEGSYGEDQMKRMEEGKGKETAKKETLEELDKDGIYGRKIEGNRVGSKKVRNRKEKIIGREETLEVLRRCYIELASQLHEVREEVARLYEYLWKKTPGMSSSPRMRKVVEETTMDGTYMDIDDPVDLPTEKFPPLLPRDGRMQDGSKGKVGPRNVRDAQVVLPVKETRSEKDEWRVVARRSRRRSGVGDDLSPSLPPRTPSRKRELIVAGLDGSVATSEIVEALCVIGGCPEEDIRMGPIRTRSNGFGTIWVQLPVAAALMAAEKGRILIGRNAARVVLLKVRPLQCFKCWAFGHRQDTCRSVANRLGACYKCGQKGHIARECENLAHCAVCFDAGKKAYHRLGGPLCAAQERHRELQ